MGDIIGKVALAQLEEINLTLNAGTIFSNEGSLFATYTNVYDASIVSTFRGFSTRIAYSGETFKAVRVTLNAEFTAYTVKCSVRDDSHNVIISKQRILSRAGSQSILFVFDEEINPSMLTDDNFYISLEIVESTGCRINTNSVVPNLKMSASEGHGNYYLNIGASIWSTCTPYNGKAMAIEIISENQISVLVPDPVIAQDTINWYKQSSLPSKIYAVVGKEMNVYFDNLIGDNIRKYNVDVICDVGKQQNERWTYIPTEAESNQLTISFYDDFNNLVMSTTSTVIAVALNAKTGTTAKCLFIGDSLTDSEVYTGELLTLFGAGDEPMNLTLIGTQGTTPNLHEGRGGYSVDDYYNNTNPSPFFISGAFNFSQYIIDNSLDTPDFVFIMLGINDVFDASIDSSVDATADANIIMLNAMITSIHAQNADCKIGIMIPTHPSTNQDSFGSDYDCGVTQWRFKRNIHRYSCSLITEYTGKESSDKIYLIPTNCNIDTVHNMSTETIDVNSRNSTQVVRQDNGVHPATAGYYQIADTVYYALKNI